MVVVVRYVLWCILVADPAQKRAPRSGQVVWFCSVGIVTGNSLERGRDFRLGLSALSS